MSKSGMVKVDQERRNEWRKRLDEIKDENTALTPVIEDIRKTIRIAKDKCDYLLHFSNQYGSKGMKICIDKLIMKIRRMEYAIDLAGISLDKADDNHNELLKLFSNYNRSCEK